MKDEELERKIYYAIYNNSNIVDLVNGTTPEVILEAEFEDFVIEIVELIKTI